MPFHVCHHPAGSSEGHQDTWHLYECHARRFPARHCTSDQAGEDPGLWVILGKSFNLMDLKFPICEMGQQ